MDKIEIWNNSKNITPIIVSIPHSGTYIPQTMKNKLIDNVILANMDWYLPNLYSFLKDLGITTHVKLEDKEINTRIAKYYTTYHQALQKLINDKLSRFNKIYLIDLHSFGKDVDKDVVLGNQKGKTFNKEYTLLIKNTLESLNFKVGLNNPYSGGYIIRKYANDKVETIQLELNYKKYIDNRYFVNEEFPKINKKLFIETQKELRNFFVKMIKVIE